MVSKRTLLFKFASAILLICVAASAQTLRFDPGREQIPVPTY